VVQERVPTGVYVSDANLRYLSAKVSHTQHTIALPFAG
jgi:GTP cyclohydrolase II